MFTRSYMPQQRPTPPPPPACTSVQPSVLAPSSLARSDIDPTFVKTILLASAELAGSVTNPAYVYLKTACHLEPSFDNRAASHTSVIFAPNHTYAQLQPALYTRSFLVPSPAVSNPIDHLTNITGTAMSSAPDIYTFIKCCQFQTI